MLSYFYSEEVDLYALRVQFMSDFGNIRCRPNIYFYVVFVQ